MYIEPNVLARTVSRNFFGKPTEISKGFLTDSEYDFPVDYVVIMDCDVSEADGEEIQVSARESLDPCIAPLSQDSLLQGDKIRGIDQVFRQQPGIGGIVTK